MKTEKNLFVEDDGFSRVVMEKLLQSSGFETQARSQSPNKSKSKAIFRIITLAFVFFLIILFKIQDSKAEGTLFAQYRPPFRSDARRDCLKSLSSLLTEEQLKILKNLQNSFYAEVAPIRRELMMSNIEFRQFISNPKVEPKVLFDQQKKILELQSKLENLSLSYQIKARSIFTNEQLEQLPWNCMLGMETGFGINFGIGIAPRRGPHW